MWNGIRKNLDMLVAMDLKYGLAQKHGTFSAEPDGTLVRDIEAVFSEGVQPLGLPVARARRRTRAFARRSNRSGRTRS